MAVEWRETLYGPVAADFMEASLGRLCDAEVGIQTGPFGSQLHQEDYVNAGTPIITVEHLGENRIRHESLPLVSDKDRDRLSRYLLRKGDIVFSRVGSVDRRALVSDQEEGWMFSGRCLRVRPNPDRIDSGFLSYFFGLPSFKEHVRSIAVGATMPSLNTSLLRDVVVFFPKSVREQRAIARFLSVLDDKIDVNRKMCESLEEMAQAVFKSWFIGFDPVRHKIENAGQTWSEAGVLFPDFFVESEGGLIPSDWSLRPIGELADIVGGSTPNTSDERNWTQGVHAWATPKDLSKLQSPVLLNTERRISDVGLAQIGSGLLPPGTVLLSSRAPIGYRAIAEIPVAINQGFIAMKPKAGVPSTFLLWWAEFAHNEILSRANGSTFLEISKSSFRSIPVVVPPQSVLDAFARVVDPLYRRIVANEREIATLTEIRDSLLPKLISGEIRVTGV